MKLHILIGICFIVFIVGCTFNIKEESKEITLTSSSAGLTEISVEKDLLEDNDIDIQGIEEKKVTVTAFVRMLVLEDEDADLDNIQLIINPSGTISYSYSGDNWQGITIEEVSMGVDKTLDLDLESVSGDINVEAMSGSLTLETTSGNIEVTMPYDTLLDSSRCYIETVSGDVGIYLHPNILEFVKTVFSISIETTSGDVKITVPIGFTADLDYDTKSGDKDISSSFIDFSGAKNVINCTTTSGDLEIETYSQ